MPQSLWQQEQIKIKNPHSQTDVCVALQVEFLAASNIPAGVVQRFALVSFVHMADFLGVQEVATESWYNTEERVAAFKTGSGWCAFWKKRPQGLPVEAGSTTTLQVACTAHDADAPATAPCLLETIVPANGCELSGTYTSCLLRGLFHLDFLQTWWSFYHDAASETNSKCLLQPPRLPCRAGLTASKV